MKTPTFRQRLQYWFDNYMSRGASALLIGLFAVSALIILLAAALVKLTHSAEESFLQVAWMGLLRTLDSGTMGGDTGSPFFLLMMFVVTLGGVFVVSALIGILNHGLEDKLTQLRKGRSQVLEQEHTLIVGWNPQIFNIVSELIVANENRKRGAVVVVVADRDKVDMEDAFRERIPNSKNTKIICRSGNPIDMADLEIGNPRAARSIIILPEGDDPDTRVIKSTLAIVNNPNRRAEPYRIVTQIHNANNMNAIKLVEQKDLILPILNNDLIARVVAQTSRQSGLSVVYTELLNFSGDEIYFKIEPTLTGRTFGEALLMYETSSVIGLRKADGRIALNPPMDSRVEQGDQIIAIAEDDDKIILAETEKIRVDEKLLQKNGKAPRPKPERTLILGWNPSGATIVRELDQYAPKGSRLTIVSNLSEKQIRLEVGKQNNQKVAALEGDIRDRSLLEKLGACDYDHVIVLAYERLEPQEADAITLVALLHLRDMAERDETPFSIVSEMLDLKNRELAEAANVDDFVVSDHLISLIMAQLSENAELFELFKDLFDSEGSEIYLKPIGDYVVTGKPVNYYAVVESARRHSETAIGYRLMSESHNAQNAYGVRVNPKKSETVTFALEDRVIVIAES